MSITLNCLSIFDWKEKKKKHHRNEKKKRDKKKERKKKRNKKMQITSSLVLSVISLFENWVMYIEFLMLYMMELDWRSCVMIHMMFGDLDDDLFFH